jgi:hypothetical protein
LISGSLRLFAIPQRKNRLTIRIIGTIGRFVGGDLSLTTDSGTSVQFEQR